MGVRATGSFDLLFDLYRADGRPDFDVVGYPDHTPDVAHLAFHFIALVRVVDDALQRHPAVPTRALTWPVGMLVFQSRTWAIAFAMSLSSCLSVRRTSSWLATALTP